MLLPLLNTHITSSFSQVMRNTDSVSFFCLRIFVNFLEINKSPSHCQVSYSFPVGACSEYLRVVEQSPWAEGLTLSFNEKWV